MRRQTRQQQQAFLSSFRLASHGYDTHLSFFLVFILGLAGLDDIGLYARSLGHSDSASAPSVGRWPGLARRSGKKTAPYD